PLRGMTTFQFRGEPAASIVLDRQSLDARRPILRRDGNSGWIEVSFRAVPGGEFPRLFWTLPGDGHSKREIPACYYGDSWRDKLGRNVGWLWALVALLALRWVLVTPSSASPASEAAAAPETSSPPPSA
ncbi:MAG TPA: hypothetical protein VNC50_01980, partial [Planctomycetia bacterium]|nr:hypothetical protein [Planctomycetia bacterium]